jgi:hypothetical protein
MVIKRRWLLVYSITEFNKIFQEQLPFGRAHRQVLAAARERLSFMFVLWPPFRELKTHLRRPRSNGDLPDVTRWLHRRDIQTSINSALELWRSALLASPRSAPRGTSRVPINRVCQGACVLSRFLCQLPLDIAEVSMSPMAVTAAYNRGIIGF